MAAATRHIKRSATVTELQQAFTERMNVLPAKDEGAHLVSLSGLTGGGPSTGSRARAAVAAPPRVQTRSREGGLLILLGAAHTLLDSFQVGASGGVPGFAVSAAT